MTDLRTAAQQALEALNSIDVGYRSPSGDPLEVSLDETKCEAAITALRAALAQQDEPVQEPVAWLYEAGANRTLHWNKPPLYGTPLYLSPPQRQPLTDEEIIDAVREADLDWTRGWTLDETQSNRFVTLARAIERAHGIGETK